MEVENGSDTGFDSGEDDTVDFEMLEERGIKRPHSDGDETENEADNKAKSKEDKAYLKKLKKPPTAEELNNLRETENLFHSNLFRLQISEMLKEVKLKKKYKDEFKSWFKKFRESILKMKDDSKKHELSDLKWLKEFNIKLPIPFSSSDGNGSYVFKKPNKVEIIGSHGLQALLGPKVTVDVFVEMPCSFFQKEDNKNLRYHRKRALYYCDLIHHVKNVPELITDVNFIADEIDVLHPKVEIIPFGKLGKHVNVILHLGPEAGTFKLNRFSPVKNNVKVEWFFKDSESNNMDNNCPTPFYNSSVLSDLVISDNHNYLDSSLPKRQNITEGIILLKIWLRQREMNFSLGSLNGFVLTMSVAYLLKIRKISPLMSSYQVFRTVCNYLCTADWVNSGITLSEQTDDHNMPTMTQFHESYSVVFVDTTGYFNICYGMSSAMFQRIQYEAEIAIRCLNNPNVNSFLILFMTPVPFYRHYDHVVYFHNGEALENVAEIHSSKQIQLSHCGSKYPQFRDLITKILTQGFRKRVNHLHIKPPSILRWQPHKKPSYKNTLILGLNLDGKNCYTAVDKAEEIEAEKFREFWGFRSQLRRFQDGTITEAVVWDAKTLAEKRLICMQIVNHLMNVKLGLRDSDYNYLADQLSGFICKDVEERTLAALSAYDRLMKNVRGLTDLPLDVVTVQGSGPVFRYSDAFPPKPYTGRSNKKSGLKNNSSIRHAIVNARNSPLWIAPMDVIMQMAASNKWPRDTEAIRRIKAAFNVKIAESLRNQFSTSCRAFQDRIELNQDGYVFHLKVFYPNEVGLLMKYKDEDGLVKYKTTEASLQLEKKSVQSPKLSAALHGLYQRHFSFGPACCIVKRWTSSHLLDSSHVSEEALELLVSSLYLNSDPHDPPQQPQVAFLRFLHMMTTVNWNTDCLILNINNEFERNDILEIESYFDRNRAELPAIFIATPTDRKKSIWTINSPTPLILFRLVQLCSKALNVIESRIYSKVFDAEVLFEPSYDAFDILIHLLPTFNPKSMILKQETKNEEVCVSKIPINGFDPVECYLRELREAFDDFALFFHDAYGGPIIAVIWKPDALKPCEVKINNMACRKYNSKSKQLELNDRIILEDFRHLGKGLVKSIEVKKNGAFIEHK